MAQRTVHYLIGEQLLSPLIPDKNRFRIGNLLPDCYSDGCAARNHTHYMRKSVPGDGGEALRWSDYEAFRQAFADRIPSDGLYLGYYMHLVEDSCFRVFCDTRRVRDRVMSREGVKRLHRDYSLLNRYIMAHYPLRYEVYKPEGFDGEPLRNVFPFRLEPFLEEFRGDFSGFPEGTPEILTEALLESFLQEAVPVCQEALRRVLGGETPFPSRYLTWN